MAIAERLRSQKCAVTYPFSHLLNDLLYLESECLSDCLLMVQTALLRWRAEKSVEHYSRSLLACQAQAVNRPTGNAAWQIKTRPCPLPASCQLKMTAQGSWHTNRQTVRQTEIAWQLRWCQPKMSRLSNSSSSSSRCHTNTARDSSALAEQYFEKIIFICATLIFRTPILKHFFKGMKKAGDNNLRLLEDVW